MTAGALVLVLLASLSWPAGHVLGTYARRRA